MGLSNSKMYLNEFLMHFSWNRGMINNVTKDEVEVFFVDYGDSLVLPLANISRLPKGFISRLPFQVCD